MRARDHGRKIVDHAIRMAFISLFALPVWVALWFGACGFIEAPPAGSPADMSCRAVAFPGLAFLRPGFASTKLLESAGLPSSFGVGVFHWLAAVVSVPAFWGAVSYGVVLLCGRLRGHAKP